MATKKATKKAAKKGAQSPADVEKVVASGAKKKVATKLTGRGEESWRDLVDAWMEKIGTDGKIKIIIIEIGGPGHK